MEEALEEIRKESSGRQLLCFDDDIPPPYNLVINARVNKCEIEK
jgi:hypothetical protein